MRKCFEIANWSRLVSFLNIKSFVAQHINQALKIQNFTKFEQLVREAGMADELDSLVNATVFAPSDDAFENAETKKLLEEIKGDTEKLKEVVMYHTVRGQLQSLEMNNNAILDSNFNSTPLRLNLYSTVSDAMTWCFLSYSFTSRV